MRGISQQKKGQVKTESTSRIREEPPTPALGEGVVLRVNPVGSMIRPLCSQLQMKVVTSAIFKGKKDSYPQSIPRSFLDTRIGE